MEREVSLHEMLDAREKRAARQKKLLAHYGLTLICFTMNIAGPIKNSPLIKEGYELGKRQLRERLNAHKIETAHFEEVCGHIGNEGYFVVKASPQSVQHITSEIEDASELGRLFDMDVLSPEGKKTGRAELGLPERRCLICGGPAKDCARSRTHTVPELQEKTNAILEEAVLDADLADVSRLACRALLYEVSTTPKPGLVDRNNSGSHSDMDIFTFMDSASSLIPYFRECTRIGRKTASLPAPETFRGIRSCGKRAESEMYAATKGINTHKGAIFSMGILCAALGRLPRSLWHDTSRLLDECAAMTKGLTASDFDGLTKETAVTTGQKLYLRYGITGVRGEMEAGLPAIRNAGLPKLREGIEQGLSVNDAGCAALLAIIAASTDTNLIARSDRETQLHVTNEIRELLERDPFPSRETIEELDRRFIKSRLSPGGSADMLAICYLLYFLEMGV